MAAVGVATIISTGGGVGCMEEVITYRRPRGVNVVKPQQLIIRTPFLLGHAHWVGLPKYSGVRLLYSSRPRFVTTHGGGVGAQMSLFGRVARIFKSYADALISFFEDPEKIIEQTILVMSDDLVKIRLATAQVLASQKQLENNYKAAQQASEDCFTTGTVGQLALGKGDEVLAREALKLKKSYADNANALKVQLEPQKSVVDNLVFNTRLLESKIQEARSKKDTLKARSQSAKTAKKVIEMVGNVNPSSALSALERMEDKVLAMESQAEALNQLTGSELEGKFALPETSLVDDDLANLKKGLSGQTMMRVLPPPLTSINYALGFQDAEVENELNELRQKGQGIL